MRRIKFALLFALLTVGTLGCGDDTTVIPTAAFTDEQKKAIQAEDAQIAEQESQGSINKKKKK